MKALNTGNHTSTGVAPSDLMSGRHIALPFSATRRVVSINRPSDYLTHLARRQYDKHRQNPIYSIDHLTFIRHDDTRSECTWTYDEPFTVVKILSPHTYIVTNEHLHREHQVHVNDMYPIFSSVGRL